VRAGDTLGFRDILDGVDFVGDVANDLSESCVGEVCQ
jgi:hypothetical protein